MSDTDPFGFRRVSTMEAGSPTLVEGLPGLGLVASIAVDQITNHLDLEYYGQIRCASLPPVTSYDDGRVQDLVRVYAGSEPSIMTLKSDLMIPSDAFDELSHCVLNDLADEFERAIFLAGAPAQSEDQIGEVTGVATTDGLEAALTDAGIAMAEGTGLIGGVTGALVNECYLHDIPAAVLIVRARAQFPDPAAAQSVIENALEPLLDFDIDTQELQEQADQIQERLQQIAQQYQQAAQQQEAQAAQPPNPSMYQ